ncbi:site-2 protease family protein [Jeotgalibacillus soli]|uniref:site-2 protease family protein n=1 Tax=Jeotgalibacillus soli TaxID=889306 RepID=UPI0012FEF703|nr:site-2 protease family protein [Jeotgalibacillus soli]
MSKRFVSLRIHPLTWGLAGVSFLTGQFLPFFILFSLIILHEAGHAAAARLFGWKFRSVTLLPFGGKLEFEECLDRPFREELIVTLAGPFQHLVMGMIAFLFLKEWIYYPLLMHLNIQLLLFNLLPLWPLDGGRCIFLLFGKFLPFLSAMEQVLLISAMGLAVSFFVMTVWFTFNLQFMFVLSYVALSCYVQWKTRFILQEQFWLERWKMKKQHDDVITLTVNSHDALYEVLKKIKKGSSIIIVIKQQEKTVGVLTDQLALQGFFKKGWRQKPVITLLQN